LICFPFPAFSSFFLKGNRPSTRGLFVLGGIAGEFLKPSLSFTDCLSFGSLLVRPSPLPTPCFLLPSASPSTGFRSSSFHSYLHRLGRLRFAESISFYFEPFLVNPLRAALHAPRRSEHIVPGVPQAEVDSATSDSPSFLILLNFFFCYGYPRICEQWGL